jgi:uncharacterized protein (TIGR02118 family)
MTKLVVLLNKRADLSREEFRRYWREVHGPLGAKMPGVRKYVQNHALADGAPFDGFAEMWFDDTAAMQAALASSESAAAGADAPNFVEKTQLMFVEEVEMV